MLHHKYGNSRTAGDGTVPTYIISIGVLGQKGVIVYNNERQTHILIIFLYDADLVACCIYDAIKCHGVGSLRRADTWRTYI